MMKRVYLFIMVCVLVVPVMGDGYQVSPGYIHPPVSSPHSPVEVMVWELPLWIIFLQITVIPLDLLVSIKVWMMLEYRRIISKNCLESGQRNRIYDYIVQNPGIHLRGIASDLSMHLGTTRYHVDMLLQTRTITGVRNGSRVGFFPVKGDLSDHERIAITYTRNHTSRTILDCISSTPSLSRQELREIVGISGPAINWHIKRMSADGIISTVHSGRQVLYEIDEGYRDIIRRILIHASDHIPECSADIRTARSTGPKIQA